MSAPGEKTRQKLREALARAREILRRTAAGDISAQPCSQCLGILCEEVADFLTDEENQARDGVGDQATAQATARTIQTLLPFSRPASFVLFDDARRLRITVTIENQIP